MISMYFRNLLGRCKNFTTHNSEFTVGGPTNRHIVKILKTLPINRLEFRPN